MCNEGVGYGEPTAAGTASDGFKIRFLDTATVKTGYGASSANGLWNQATTSGTGKAFYWVNEASTGVLTELMTLLASNRLGLGKATPLSRIHTEQSVTLTTMGAASTADQGLTLINSNNSTGKYYGIQFGGYASYTFGGLYGTMTSANGNTVGDLVFSSRRATGDTTFTENVRIVGTTGYLGVGTNAPTSTLHNGGSLTVFYRAITALRTLDATDYFIDCTANTFNVTLPTAVNIAGRTYVIKNSGTGVITVDTTSSQTIDGSTTRTLATQYGAITVVSDGANWKIITG